MSCLNMALEMIRAGKSIIPIQPRGKKPILKSWDEYQTRIATAEEVAEWFRKYPDANIGLVCGAISGIVAVDVDGEEGQTWFRENMPKPNCYQFTSGKSKFHAFYSHPGRKVAPAVRIAPEVDIRGDGSYVVFAPSVHASGVVYSLHHLDGFSGWDSLVPCPDLEALKQRPDAGLPQMQSSLGTVTEGSRNATLTAQVGRWLGKGLSLEETLCFAVGWNDMHCNPPLSAKEVQRTVESVYKTHTGNHPLAVNADGIRKWVEAIPGQFNVQMLDAELGIKDHDAKLHRAAMLEILAREGVVERVGAARGTYRVKDRSIKVIDIDAPESPEVNLWLPFGLNRNLKIHQKNIIVVAGETNAGKTSLLFNMAAMQSQNSQCRYACSEMNGAEINEKIQAFGGRNSWSHCEFVERTQNFHDIVLPDGINFIDYLEVYDNFFRIGEDIRKIYDALDTGVAIVAIQKATGAELGRGGAFTIEKARLAISLFSHGKMLDGIIGSAKVTKAKNIRPGWNPEGREIFYTLRSGYYFDAGDLPAGITDLHRGWWFYDKKVREKVCQKIESYCRAYETHEGMEAVDFYA